MAFFPPTPPGPYPVTYYPWVDAAFTKPAATNGDLYAIWLSLQNTASANFGNKRFFASTNTFRPVAANPEPQYAQVGPLISVVPPANCNGLRLVAITVIDKSGNSAQGALGLICFLGDPSAISGSVFTDGQPIIIADDANSKLIGLFAGRGIFPPNGYFDTVDLVPQVSPFNPAGVNDAIISIPYAMQDPKPGVVGVPPQSWFPQSPLIFDFLKNPGMNMYFALFDTQGEYVTDGESEWGLELFFETAP
jgi:hypothetical protein